MSDAAFFTTFAVGMGLVILAVIVLVSGSTRRTLVPLDDGRCTQITETYVLADSWRINRSEHITNC